MLLKTALTCIRRTIHAQLCLLWWDPGLRTTVRPHILTFASLIRANHVPLERIQASRDHPSVTIAWLGLTHRKWGTYWVAPSALPALTPTTELLDAHRVLPGRGRTRADLQLA